MDGRRWTVENYRAELTPASPAERVLARNHAPGRSRSRSFCFRSTPQRYPPSSPVPRITRWHGMTMATRLLAQAPATARAAVGWPMMTASSWIAAQLAEGDAAHLVHTRCWKGVPDTSRGMSMALAWPLELRRDAPGPRRHARVVAPQRDARKSPAEFLFEQGFVVPKGDTADAVKRTCHEHRSEDRGKDAETNLLAVDVLPSGLGRRPGRVRQGNGGHESSTKREGIGRNACADARSLAGRPLPANPFLLPTSTGVDDLTLAVDAEFLLHVTDAADLHAMPDFAELLLV